MRISGRSGILLLAAFFSTAALADETKSLHELITVESACGDSIGVCNGLHSMPQPLVLKVKIKPPASKDTIYYHITFVGGKQMVTEAIEEEIKFTKPYCSFMVHPTELKDGEFARSVEYGGVAHQVYPPDKFYLSLGNKQLWGHGDEALSTCHNLAQYPTIDDVRAIIGDAFIDLSPGNSIPLKFDPSNP